MATRKTDIEWVESAFFVDFYPVTDNGREVWGQMLEQAGTTKFPFHLKNNIITQLKDAGYKVRKASKIKKSDKELLADLGL